MTPSTNYIKFISRLEKCLWKTLRIGLVGLCYCLLTLACFSNAHSQASISPDTLRLSEYDISSGPLINKKLYYLSTTATLPFEKILQIPDNDPRWRSNMDDSLAPGFSHQRYWLRLDLMNDSRQPRESVLIVRDGFLDSIKIYEQQGSSYQQHPTLGIKHLHNTYGVSSRFPNIIINSSPQQHKRLYLEISSRSAITIPIQLTSLSIFHDINNYHIIIYALYSGALAMLVLYNLLLYTAFRSPAYLYYSLFVFCWLSTTLSADAWHIFYFPGSSWAVNHGIATLLYCASITSVLFSNSFLHLHTHLPRLNKIITAYCLIGCLGILYSQISSDRLSQLLSIAYIIPALVINTYSAIWGLGLKTRATRYFFISWMFVITATSVVVAAHIGLLPAIFADIIILIVAQIIQALIMSFALAEHIRQTKNQEILAKQNEQIASAKEQAKSQLLATMSHEIRTPMNGILGVTEMLNNTLLDEKQKRYTLLIESSGRTLLAIINDILDYSKIEADKMNIRHKSFNLPAAIDSCMAIFLLQAEQRQLQFTLMINPGTPLNVDGDEQRIKQILINLLGNAFKFTHQGSITVIVEPCHSDSLTRIGVRDTGLGIPADKTSDLFEAFSQVADEAIDSRSGTGLGLSICKKLTKLMGGHIYLKSQYQQGSFFWIEIPLPQSTAPHRTHLTPIIRREKSEIKTTSPHTSKRKLEVLVAEDNSVNQLVITTLLHKMGHHYSIVNNGQEAIDTVHKKGQKGLDIILMDCEMPIKNGFLATEEIKSLYPDGLPIIACTAHIDDELLDKCKACGADDVITKPIDYQALTKIIQRFCQSQ